MNLERRIARIEADVVPISTESKPEDDTQRLAATWDALFATMAYEDAESVARELVALWQDESDWYGKDGKPSPGKLTRTAHYMVSLAILDKLQGPLALPPVVAQVYRNDPRAIRGLVDCEMCGYGLPLTPHDYPTGGCTRYFDTCPLCGGRVGSNYYTYSRDPELRRRAFGDDRWPR